MAAADPPMCLCLCLCHLLAVLSYMLVIAWAQLEPTGEAPNASPPELPSSLLGPVAPPAFSPTIDFPPLSPAESPAMAIAPTPAAHSLSPSGSADTPTTGSIVAISPSSPPSQAAPAPTFETTHSPPAPPSTPLLGAPPSPWRSSSPTSSSSSSATSSSKEGLSAAKKAGISMGVLLTAALACLIAFIIKRRRHNIQRSEYGHSQYRGYRGGTL